MSVSILFFFAALAQNAAASRFHPTPALHVTSLYTSHASHLHDPMAHAPERLPSHRTQEIRASLEGQQVVDNWRASLEGAGQERNFSTYYRFQSFPPTKLYGIDTIKILRTWSQFFMPVGLSKLSIKELQVLLPYNGSWLFNGAPQDRLNVLEKMVEDIREPSSYLETDKYDDTWALVDYVPSVIQTIKRGEKKRIDKMSVKLGPLEAVGLMPNDPSATAESMMALGVFSRKKLNDDSTGSLLKIVEAQFGIRATRGIFGVRAKKRISVFAIQGLAESPFSSDLSARVLLARIAEWADYEQKLVVVPRHVIHAKDGTDLTEYYIGLGFKKVELDNGSHELVYSYPSTGNAFSASVMIGLSLWPDEGQLIANGDMFMTAPQLMSSSSFDGQEPVRRLTD